MRLLFIILCLPLFAAAQDPGRRDDSLRKISDTMHFPVPFAFKTSANTNLSPAALTKACFGWMDFLKDSLKSIVVLKDPMHKKVAAGNVPATADLTFSILLEAKGSKYTCTLQKYAYHAINGQSLPVAKAAMIKDYKMPTNIEKVLVMRSYQWVFYSLSRYLEKAH